MADYGITPSGFEIKPFSVLFDEASSRAKAMFGDDVDLHSSSAVKKILDLACFGEHELWKQLERAFYAGFVATADGESLDLSGEGLGIARRFLSSRGQVKLKLANEAPGRTYNVPAGTLLETDPPRRVFRTLVRLSLSASQKEGEIPIEAIDRGPQGNVAAGAILRIVPEFAQRRLRLGAATITPTQAAPTQGGETLEDDETFRIRLLGLPRTLWTLPSVAHAIREVDGVRDVRLLDPAGGVDVSLSRFKLFAFGQRRFGTRRLYGTPYRFHVLVATHPGYSWERLGGVPGLLEKVQAAIDPVRPVSIFPDIRRANHVRVALRARLRTAPGHDRPAVEAAARSALERRILGLGLGRSVLFSEVLYDLMSVPGVLDVTGLRLRRCPPQLGRISFGRHPRFAAAEIELAVGESIDLAPDEIAEFRFDDDLLDLEISDR